MNIHGTEAIYPHVSFHSGGSSGASHIEVDGLGFEIGKMAVMCLNASMSKVEINRLSAQLNDPSESMSAI